MNFFAPFYFYIIIIVEKNLKKKLLDHEKNPHLQYLFIPFVFIIISLSTFFFTRYNVCNTFLKIDEKKKFIDTFPIKNFTVVKHYMYLILLFNSGDLYILWFSFKGFGSITNFKKSIFFIAFSESTRFEKYSHVFKFGSHDISETTQPIVFKF